MMAKKNGILIFTKNREKLLKKSIDALSHCEIPIFVVDDSTSEDVRQKVSSLCMESNIYYHGLKEQAQLLEIAGNGVDTRFFLKLLGDGEWNLGFARNHALLLAFMFGLEKVLFLDDDIYIADTGLVHDIFSALDQYQVVGSKVAGMPDDSLLGHMSTKANIEQKRLYSGGCLAFKMDIVDECFLNIYNEDWIWQYMQLKAHPHTLLGEVYHELFNPFDKWKQKIVFQELGELFVDGLDHAVATDDFRQIELEEYWNGQLEERKDYLRDLKIKFETVDECEFPNMVRYLLEHYPVIGGHYCSKIFKNYFIQKKLFHKAVTLCSLVRSQLLV
jgi:glycosyltransferase involved in cell wall biosynthesis